MRTVGLIALVVLFPSFAHAAALVNINTADVALLDTLPHIGATTAQKIIDYRIANGPFKSIGDIRNASAYISLNYYADIAPLITVGDTGASSVADTSTTASSTPVAPAASGGTTTYVPPPSSISIRVSGNESAIREVPLRLSARVTAKNGAVDSGARIVWSFGDGSSGEGSAVEKTYRYLGTYLVVVTATDGQAMVLDDFIVVVKPAVVRIAALSGEGVTLANDSSERLDLSGWRLLSLSGSFRIPEGTILLPNASVLFPSAITNLPVTLDMALLYPNSILATRYVPPVVASTSETTVVEQLSSSPVSYKQVQTVEPFISTKTTVQSYENKAVIAPAATPDKGVAAGAAVSPPSLAAAVTAPSSHTPVADIFHSVWTLGLVGVIVLAGGAFILL